MYGLIITNFSSYLIHKYGEEAWDNIRRLANLDTGTFGLHSVYPEQLLGRIAKKAFSTLGIYLPYSLEFDYCCQNSKKKIWNVLFAKNL